VSSCVCCDFCGRDTVNKSGICRRCMSGVRKHKKPIDYEEDDIRVVREIFHLDGDDRYTEIDRDIRRVMEEAIS
jgi:hypothetical protein